MHKSEGRVGCRATLQMGNDPPRAAAQRLNVENEKAKRERAAKLSQPKSV